MHARLGGIARAVIRRGEIEHVDREPLFVYAVCRADTVNGRDEAPVFGRPAGGVLGNDAFRPDHAAVALHAPGKDRQRGLGRFRPVHSPAYDDREFVVIPKDTCAHRCFEIYITN